MRTRTSRPTLPLITDVTLVVDQSASMAVRGLAQSVRDGIRSFLQEQTSGNDKGNHIRVVTFCDRAEVALSGTANVLNASNFDDCAAAYAPSGCTRLIDTVLEEVSAQRARVEARVAAWPPAVRALDPARAVVLAVLTDGQDNQSKRSPQELHTAIEEHRQWGAVCQFIAANQDAVQVGAGLGFSEDLCLQMDATPDCASGALRAASLAIGRATSGEGGDFALAFTPAERTLSSQQPEFDFPDAVPFDSAPVRQNGGHSASFLS